MELGSLFRSSLIRSFFGQQTALLIGLLLLAFNASAARIYLIEELSSSPVLVDDAENRLLELGQDVVRGGPLEDYSGFDQVWDGRWAFAGGYSAAEVAAFQAYLSAGGRLLIMGENSLEAETRNESIVALLNAIGAGSTTLLSVPDAQVGSSQFVTLLGQELFNDPNFFTELATPFSRIVAAPTQGFLISSVSPSVPDTGSYLAWAFGDITGRDTAKLVVVFDGNIFNSCIITDPTSPCFGFPEPSGGALAWSLEDARNFTENAVTFLSEPELTEVVEVPVAPPPVNVPDVPVFDPGVAGNEDLIYDSAASLVVQAPAVDLQTLFCLAPDPRFDLATGVFTPRELAFTELAGLGTCPDPLTVGGNPEPGLTIPPYARGFADVSGQEVIAIGLVDADELVVQGLIEQEDAYFRLAGFEPQCENTAVNEIPFAMGAPIPEFGEKPNPEGDRVLSVTYTCNRRREVFARYSGQAFGLRLATEVLSPQGFVLDQTAGLASFISSQSCISRRFRSGLFRAVTRAQRNLARNVPAAISAYENVVLAALLELEKPNLGAFAGCISSNPSEDFDPDNTGGVIANRALVIAGSAYEFLINDPLIPYVPPPEILARLPQSGSP